MTDSALLCIDTIAGPKTCQVVLGTLVSGARPAIDPLAPVKLSYTRFEFGGGAAVTVTDAVPVSTPLVAVTVAVPAVAPVTVTVAPFGARVTTPLVVAVQTTDWPVIAWPN